MTPGAKFDAKCKAVADTGYNIQKYIIPDQYGFFSHPFLDASLRRLEGFGFICSCFAFNFGLPTLVMLEYDRQFQPEKASSWLTAVCWFTLISIPFYVLSWWVENVRVRRVALCRDEEATLMGEEFVEEAKEEVGYEEGTSDTDKYRKQEAPSYDLEEYEINGQYSGQTSQDQSTTGTAGSPKKDSVEAVKQNGGFRNKLRKHLSHPIQTS